MNAQFADATANALGIPNVTVCQPIEARGNQRPAPNIAQTKPPSPECLRLPKLWHLSFINDLRPFAKDGRVGAVDRDPARDPNHERPCNDCSSPTPNAR